MDSIKDFMKPLSNPPKRTVSQPIDKHPPKPSFQYLPIQLDSSSQSSSDDQSSNLNVDEKQIQLALKLCKKIKKIGKKQSGYTNIKKENSKVSKLFSKMSGFFGLKHKRLAKAKEERKKLKELKKQIQKGVGIHKQQRQNINKYNNPELQPAVTQQLFDIQPEIQQQQEQHQQQQVEIPNLNLGEDDSKYQDLRTICYICKVKFTEIHHFYSCLCIQCGNFNYAKRTQIADLTGLVAVVTGARIKIGFEIALKLLRDGAKVFATSRFFNDAFLRYKKEADYEKWSDRLFIIECDFTSAMQVQRMIEQIRQNCGGKVDILINNAAQTIVRPKQFYLQQVRNSQKKIQCMPQHIKNLMIKTTTLTNQQNQKPLTIQERYPSIFLPEQGNGTRAIGGDAETTALAIINSKNPEINHNKRDAFDQPIDMRSRNSWVQKLCDVSLTDCLSTQIINSVVPFHIIGKLKDIMQKKKGQVPSWVVNVSSMEGVFYRCGKQAKHPHTNMAKASMNMITRTSANQFQTYNIYMNSIDTGWITEQNPYGFVEKSQRFIPLDCLDGAMRVLDPVYLGVRQGKFPFGKFLKDYKDSRW